MIMVKSRLKIFFVLLALVMAPIAVALGYVAVRMVISGPAWGDLWAIALLVFVVFMGAATILREVRYLKIDGTGGKITYYSLVRPWGRTLDLGRYTGKFVLSESNAHYRGYGVVYLTDGKRVRRLLSGHFYRNADEMYAAIGLPEVKSAGLGFWRWVKLSLFGRVSLG